MSIKQEGKTYTAIISYKVGTKYRRKVKRGFPTKKSAQQYEAQMVTKLADGYTLDASEMLFVDYFTTSGLKHT